MNEFGISVEMFDGENQREVAKFKNEEYSMARFFVKELEDLCGGYFREGWNPDKPYVSLACNRRNILFSPLHKELKTVKWCNENRITKRELAEEVLFDGAVFDTAVPSPWADSVVDKLLCICDMQDDKRYLLYSLIFNTVWFYPEGSSFGMPIAITQETEKALVSSIISTQEYVYYNPKEILLESERKEE